MVTPGKISLILFDFDGLFRHFDPQLRAQVEADFDLLSGSIYSAAFIEQDYVEVAKGLLNKQQWINKTADILGCYEAAKLVLSEVGEVDNNMVALLEDVKQAGFTTALLTNSTDTIDQELKDFGLSESFDYLFTTHKIGFAKPEPEVFKHVCTETQHSPDEIFFTDDLQVNIDGARAFGLTAELFTSPENLRATLEKL